MGETVQRVFLHVGAPKTGTTYCQQVLFAHRERLREAGVLYPAQTYDEHFFAAVDLQDLDFSGLRRPEAAGVWDRLAARVREWPGTSVISHDVFAGASAEHVARAVESLAPAQVHVVMTVRDLARQLPSHWQEDVKHGQARSFAAWYSALRERRQDSWHLRWFWRSEEVPDVLHRWGSTLAPEQVHVVTVPPAGGPRGELWRRFAGVVGIDADLDLDVVRHHNQGLGVAEVELLRAVATVRDDRLGQRDYEHLVKGVVAHETLERLSRSPRFGLPPALLPEIDALAREWSEAVRAAGYHVVGDLDDLLPLPRDPAQVDPDSASADSVAEVGATAIYESMLRLQAERDEIVRLRGEVGMLRHQRDEARGIVDEHRGLSHWVRIKRTVVEIGRTSRSVAMLLRAWRRGRDAVRGWLRRG